MTPHPKLVDRVFALVFFTFRNRVGGAVDPLPPLAPLAGAARLEPPEDYEAAATLYGNRYRGAFLLNFALGFLAVVLALVPLSGLVPEHALHEAAIPLSVAEIACIVAIMLIHWHGREPSEHESLIVRTLHVLGLHNLNQGWRRRWGHARLAAGHVMFSDLMLCFPGVKLYGDNILDSAGSDYAPTAQALHALAQRLPVAPSSPDYVASYRTYFLDLIRHQRAYHQNNAHRYHHIYHRVHTTATACFYLTLVACGAHLHWHHPALSVLAALLPALGATCHGILASGEFNKLSSQSQDMVKALRTLDTRASATSPADLDALRDQVQAFFRLVVQEAVGWHVALSDKDVPVA